MRTLLLCCFQYGYSVCTCYIFFFKQKTAYEMRISDWSSDVCSSDLRFCRRIGGRAGDGNGWQRQRNGEQGCQWVQGHRTHSKLDCAQATRSEERRVGKECVVSVDLGGRRIIKKKNMRNIRRRHQSENRIEDATNHIGKEQLEG